MTNCDFTTEVRSKHFDSIFPTFIQKYINKEFKRWEVTYFVVIINDIPDIFKEYLMSIFGECMKRWSITTDNEYIVPNELKDQLIISYDQPFDNNTNNGKICSSLSSKLLNKIIFQITDKDGKNQEVWLRDFFQYIIELYSKNE